MMGQDIIEPVNTIICEDNGLVIEEFEVGANATPAKMLPGTFVIYDTVAGNVKEAGAAADGVLGILMESETGSLTTAYAVGDVVRVITGGSGKVLMRRGVSAGAIAPGTPLATVADGLVGPRAVGALGAQGDVVGVGAVILGDSTAEAYVVAELKIVPDQQATA